MKQLHNKVNIVPVIGKADTLTPTELVSMKRRVSYLMMTWCRVFNAKLSRLFCETKPQNPGDHALVPLTCWLINLEGKVHALSIWPILGGFTQKMCTPFSGLGYRKRIGILQVEANERLGKSKIYIFTGQNILNRCYMYP